MNKKIVYTSNAPEPIGPYSQGVRWSNLFFASGQVPIDPKSGKIETMDIEKQTRQVLENLEAVLTAAGSNLNQVVKTTIFITDMNDFSKINSVYGEFFTGDYPARSCVEVSSLPKGAFVEIEAVAVIL